MTRRKKIGDIYEVRTKKGFAYFQYTHEYTKPPKWGSLIRVLDGFYEQKPTTKELKALVNKQHRFQTFCFLQQGIKTGEVLFIDNLLVPEFAQEFPIFKGTNSSSKRNPLDKVWWLWNGDTSWKIGKLSIEELKKYPLKELCDITALVSSIEKGTSLGDILC